MLQTRRARDELVVGGGAHDATEQPIGLVDVAAREQQLGEIEVHREETIVLGDRAPELRDGVVDVLAPAVHLAELLVALGVVGRELDGLRRVRMASSSR